MQFRNSVFAAVVAAGVGIGGYAVMRGLDPMKLVSKPALKPDPDPTGKPKDSAPVEDPYTTSHFWVGRTEVTVGAFKRFLAESGYAFPPAMWDGQFGVRAVSPKDEDRMVNVNLRDARAFCAWLSKREGRPYFLPTEPQWMQADEQHDCSGGVWEWCSLEGDTDELFAEKKGEDGAPTGVEPDVRRALRGGSAKEPIDKDTGTDRKVLPFYARAPNVGFRVATTREKPAATVVPAASSKTVDRAALAEHIGLTPANTPPKADDEWKGIELVEIKATAGK